MIGAAIVMQIFNFYILTSDPRKYVKPGGECDRKFHDFASVTTCRNNAHKCFFLWLVT